MANDVRLRYINQNDALSVLHWENELEEWNDNRGEIQFTLLEINLLIQELQDIQKSGQARWIIENNVGTIGCVDLTEIDFKEGSASVGILVALTKERRKGIASRALELLEAEAKKMNIFKLISHVRIENQKSLSLFRKSGYQLFEKSEEIKLDNGTIVEVRKFEKCLKE